MPAELSLGSFEIATSVQLSCPYRSDRLSSRCLTTVQRYQPPLEPPLPFGGFYAPLDRSVQPVQLLRSPPSGNARSPFAPRRLSLNCTGSTFQVRYIPLGSLLPEPLGTTFNIVQNPFEVNKKLGLLLYFPLVLSHSLSMGYTRARVKEL